MKKFLFVATVMLASQIIAAAQIPRPSESPAPVIDPRVEEMKRQADDLKRRTDSLWMLQQLPPELPERERREFLNAIEPLYRESTDEERDFMSPSAEDREAYGRFENRKNSGLIVLAEDRGCTGNTNVVSATVNCSRYSMPGAGAGYSFRFGDYRIHRLADIVYRKGNLEALGVLNHGIMVDLGDVSFETLNEKSEGIEYLAEIKPSKDFQQAAEFATRLTKGIKEGGRTYASILPVRENSTYVIRSIAYEGEAFQNVTGIVYNELDIDKRRDVLIAFRVVRLADGSATIVWKELDDSRAPKLKPNKK